MTRPMDSQVTLVNPTPFSAQERNAILWFDRDDMRNTAIHVGDDPRPSYFVKTIDSKTTISAAGDVLLATVERKTLRQDQIMFRDSPPMNLGSWLKASKMSMLWVSCTSDVIKGLDLTDEVSPLTFQHDDRRFEWNKNFVGQLVLREAGHSNSLAWFSKSRRGHRDGRHVLYYAYLTIKPEGYDMVDVIVLSCILGEHKLRVKGNKRSIQIGQGGDTMNPFAFGL